MTDKQGPRGTGPGAAGGLADLALAHPEEFRETLAGEDVMSGAGHSSAPLMLTSPTPIAAAAWPEGARE